MIKRDLMYEDTLCNEINPTCITLLLKDENVNSYMYSIYLPSYIYLSYYLSIYPSIHLSIHSSLLVQVKYKNNRTLITNFNTDNFLSLIFIFQSIYPSLHLSTYLLSQLSSLSIYLVSFSTLHKPLLPVKKRDLMYA